MSQTLRNRTKQYQALTWIVGGSARHGRDMDAATRMAPTGAPAVPRQLSEIDRHLAPLVLGQKVGGRPFGPVHPRNRNSRAPDRSCRVRWAYGTSIVHGGGERRAEDMAGAEIGGADSVVESTAF